MEKIYRKITGCAGKNVMMDISDSLSPAAPEYYASVHGTGGKNGYNSTLTFNLCDYSKGRGDNAVMVSVNIELEVFPLLMAVAQDRMVHGDKLPAPASTTDHIISKEAINELQKIYTGLGTAYKEKTPVDAGKVGMAVKAVIGGIKAPVAADTAPQYDYSYSSEKVNAYKAEGGKAPVTRVSIYRQPFMADGSKKRIAWSIQVVNAIAPISTNALGSTTFNSKQMEQIKKVSINVSDMDMYRMMNEAIRYINIWNMTRVSSVKKVLEVRNQAHQQAQD